MTAALHPPGPHACSPIDACRQVMARCQREAIAAYLGVSCDTIDRMRSSPIDARWSDARVQAVKRFEEAVLGTDTVRAALVARELRPASQRMEAIAGVSRDIGEAASLIAQENSFLAHGAKDAREALTLADAIEQHALHELDEAAALRARTGGAA